MNSKLQSVTLASAALLLASCGANSPTPPAKLKSQQLICMESVRTANRPIDDPIDPCMPPPDPTPDPAPAPGDSDYISMPGTPTLIPWNSANVAPGSAASRITAQWVPTDATDREDYVRKLFTQVNKNVTPAYQVPGTTVTDGRCAVTHVDAITAPEQLIAEQSTASTVFPSVILQGHFLAVQGNSPTPIHVPSTQRQSVNLVDSYFNTATMPTSTYTDYAQALRTMLLKANSDQDFTQSNIMFEVKSASTVEEASQKFNLDFKAFGADVKAKLDNGSSKTENSVYAVFYQKLYDVRVDLSGNYPVNGLFNSNFGLNEISKLGNDGEIDSTNPPAFASGTSLGRLLIVRVSSNATTSDLESSVNATFKFGSTGVSTHDKEIMNTSHMTIYAAGGTADPQIAVIKSGDYKSYFDTSRILISSLTPMSHTINYWDDTLMRVNRTYDYEQRICDPIPAKKIQLRFREVYDNAEIFVKPSGTNVFKKLNYSGNPGTVDVTPELLAEDAQIRVGVVANSPGFWDSYRWKMHFDLLVDGNVVPDIGIFDENCYGCHSEGNLVTWTVNKFTGDVYRINKWSH